MRKGPSKAARLLTAGALVAVSMPPWGWWPLAFVGCAVYAGVAANEGRRAPFRTAVWWAAGWFVPSLAWMWFLTVPGYVLVVLIFAALHGAAATVAAAVGRVSNGHHLAALVVCHTLAETVRLSAPFGGVPLATMAHSQSQSPLAALAGTGGVILITLSVFALSFLGHRLRTAVVLAAVVLASVPFDTTHHSGEATFTLVQGGGEQGTHVGDVPPRDVFLAHLAATRSIQPDASRTAVVWPENVINITGRGAFTASRERAEIAAEARRLGVPFVVGITEDAGGGAFTNAQVVVQPDGTVSDRYDKKRRVPFGEYMPLRSLLGSLGAPVDLVPRDAVPGTTPAHVDAQGIRMAVAISWEVFFGGRVNEGIDGGGRVIVNPTNGSSYTWTILQTQQIASSRIRAREQGRWVLQVAPTGFSAFVSPDGEVLDRTAVSEQRVIERTVDLHSGRTPYSRTGNAPYIWGLLTALAVLMLRARGANRRGRS
jgi:apolipoprotein N-acyltransferase